VRPLLTVSDRFQTMEYQQAQLTFSQRREYDRNRQPTTDKQPTTKRNCKQSIRMDAVKKSAVQQ